MLMNENSPVNAVPQQAVFTRPTAIWRLSWFPVFLLLALLIVAYIVKQASDLAQTVPRALTSAAAALAPSPTVIEVDRIAMVRALQEKFEVTTFTMRLEKNIPAGSYRQEDNAWQHLWEYGRTDLVPADVNAGYDWGGFKPEQITATHETVTVDLGPPKIMSVVIDHKNVKNVSEYTGLGVGWPDITLESQILTKAEAAFRKDACTNGVLKAAALSAEKQVGAFLQVFLRAAGDKRTVKVVSQSPTC